MRPASAAVRIASLGEALVIYNKLSERSREGSCDVARMHRNAYLNRWNNILPYDGTRVKLTGMANGNDYINASRVEATSLLDTRSYILTQGPLVETIGHFWTMVWQQNCNAIVMLCKLKETGICKCERYWPATPSDDDLIVIPDQNLEVRLRGPCEPDSDSVVRHLELRHSENDSIRVITQYHYLSWPDFQVPDSTSSFLDFLKRVNRAHPSTPASPNVVHCSAGVGRSGTFCLVDVCLERMARTKRPMSRDDVFDALVELRRARMGLIQTPEQLLFSLEAIADAMNGMDFSSDGPKPKPNSRKRSTDNEDNERAAANGQAEAQHPADSAPKRPKNI